MATTKQVAEFLMLALALLGAVSCLSRMDCNFPVFAYLWWMFFYVPEEKKRQQRCMISFVFLSTIQDCFFICYWPIKWFSHDWLAISSETEGLHAILTVVALIEITFKVLLLCILLVPDIGVNTPKAVKLWWQRLGAAACGQSSDRVGGAQQLQNQGMSFSRTAIPPASSSISAGYVSSPVILPGSTGRVAYA